MEEPSPSTYAFCKPTAQTLVSVCTALPDMLQRCRSCVRYRTDMVVTKLRNLIRMRSLQSGGNSVQRSFKGDLSFDAKRQTSWLTSPGTTVIVDGMALAEELPDMASEDTNDTAISCLGDWPGGSGHQACNVAAV
ncbi:unnamed protein product [Dicrocoelium dendriticum]|nr:unnamed protein product [Dicrocoelium dendriticum]